jgi:hypothetical protein
MLPWAAGCTIAQVGKKQGTKKQPKEDTAAKLIS